MPGVHTEPDVPRLLPYPYAFLLNEFSSATFSTPHRPPQLSWLAPREQPQQHVVAYPPQQQSQQPWPQHLQQRPDQQLQQLRQDINSKPRSSSSSSSASSRCVPTASGAAPGPKASQSPAARAPVNLNLALRAFGGAGVGAGGGGLFCGPCQALTLRLWPLGGRSKPAAGDKKQKTVLIMMSNTGGGHKASAEALQQAFEEKYGNKYKVVIADMWKQHTPAPFNTMPDSYSFLVRHGWLWRFTYNAIQPRSIHIPYFSAIHTFVAASLSEAFDSYDPDLVVSVHPLMQHIPTRVLAARAKRLGRAAPAPFATVVTDFTTCHNTWFCRDVNKCFVPTEFCKQLGRAMGLAEQQLVLHGLPIRPIFSKRLPSRKALRKQLGLLPDVPAVLLVGGGEGMGKLAATVEQLDAKLQGSAQVVVICGRNKQLLGQLRTKAWPGGSHVVACGFVDNIHEWMAAVDTIITKAGPGTIAEALISGLPILLNGNVPCQEEGNIPYVVDNGVGAFETDPAAIADIMADWLAPDNKEEFRQMAHRSAALGRPQAVYQIVHDLAALADEVGAKARQLLPGNSGRGCCKGKAKMAVGQLAAA